MANYNVLTLSEPVADFVATTSPETINVQCSLTEDAQRKKVWAVCKAGGIPAHPYDGVRVQMDILPGFPLSDLTVGGGKIAVPMADGSKQIRRILHKGNPDPGIYPESCNGVWTAPLVMPETRVWHSSDVNDYAASDINQYLNGDGLARYNSRFVAKINKVKIPYRPGSGTGKTVNSGENGLPVKEFLLSHYEVGLGSLSEAPIDGAKLDYFLFGTGDEAKAKRLGYVSGGVDMYTLRTPNAASDGTKIRIVNTSGTGGRDTCTIVRGEYPVMILPFDLLLDFTPNADGSFNPIL